MSHPKWLYTVFELDISDSEEAVDLLYDKMNTTMHEGKFSLIDSILNDIRVDEISITIMIGLLTCSRWCQDKLIHREWFVKRCRNSLLWRGRSDVDLLLAGLE